MYIIGACRARSVGPDHPATYHRLQLLVDGLTAGGPPLDVPASAEATGELSRHWASRGR